MSDVLVCWSGGRDSTLVLCSLLAKHEGRIRTLSITSDSIGAQAEQLAARTALKAKFIECGYRPFESITVHVDLYKEAIRPADGGLLQPVVWVSLASLILHKDETLAMGYCHGDDACHHLHDLQSLFHAAQRLLGKTGDITFPAEWWSKPVIFASLRNWKVFDLTWWCEDPQPRAEGAEPSAVSKALNLAVEPCGKCHPCVINRQTQLAMDAGLWTDEIKRAGAAS